MRAVVGLSAAAAFCFGEACYGQDGAPEPAAHARLASDGDRVVYEAAYFAQYSPRNALDMAEQTPGFSLSGGSGRRGFSGAVGNILIDGLRPGTKSQSAEDILSRIPADQVVRLEVLRGAAVAGDASGASMLLNVVRKPSAGGGVWEAGVEYRSGNGAAPRGEVAYSGRRGQLEYGVGGSYVANDRGDEAFRRVFDANGVHIRDVDTPSTEKSSDWTVNADIAHPLWGGRIKGTAQVEGRADDEAGAFLTTDPLGGFISDRQTVSQEESTEYELGLTYERSFGRWDATLLGLINRGKEDGENSTIRRDAAGSTIDSGTDFESQQTGESIVRGTLAGAFAPHRVEFGAEVAFNMLEQSFRSDSLTPVPNANIRVDEKRADLFAAYAWASDNGWSLETRLAWETSTLTFSGDTDQAVDLSYWKPSAQLSKSFGDDQVRVRLYRDVSQLDFDSFASAVELSEERIAGGNPDLKPTTAWIGELGADLRFGGAALSLTLSHHRLSDVEDQVLIVAPGPNPGDPPIRFVAPGNIGDGKRNQIEVNFKAPLDFLLPGAQITLDGTWRDTEVTDPVTGLKRQIGGTSEYSYEAEFRHDIRSLRTAWGVNVSKSAASDSFRFDEISTRGEGAFISAFVETSALPHGLKLSLLVEDLGGRATDTTRLLFAPDRTGPLSGFETRRSSRSSAPWVRVSLSGKL